MIQRPPSSTPVRWPALLLFSLLGLQGCSLLPPSLGGPGKAPEVTGVPEDAPLAFTLDVQAPKDIAQYLTKNMELQRFRRFPGLQARELSRLLGAADDNARELLGTLGYFSPSLTLEMIETPETPEAPETEAPRRIVLTVEPGPQTQIASVDISVNSPDGEATEGALQRTRVERQWPLMPGQAFSQSGWDDAKGQGLRTLRQRRYPTARIASSRAEVDADTHEAKLAVTYDPGPPYRFGPLQVRGSQRYDPDGARRLARLPTGSVYDEAEMLDAQQRLANSGYYDAVFLTLDTESPDPQAAPVIAQVREAKLQKLVFGAGLSTDSGPRLSVDHSHNQWPTHGWRAVNKLSLDKNAQQLGTGWTALPNDNGWRWFTSALAQRQQTGDYDVNSVEVLGGRSKSTKNIDRTYFLRYGTTPAEGQEAKGHGDALRANNGWKGR